MAGILTQEDIQEARREGKLVIEPLDNNALQPTSYDVAAGYLLADNDVIENFDETELVPLEFKKFLSVEYFRFPNDIIGHLYLRSTYARMRLIPIHQGRIEAGWRGRLVIEIFNASKKKIRIKRGDRLVTMEFIRLPKPVQEGYNGKFQDFMNSLPCS